MPAGQRLTLRALLRHLVLVVRGQAGRSQAEIPSARFDAAADLPGRATQLRSQ